jgi:hypothetical protein
VTGQVDDGDRRPYRYLDYFDEADRDFYFGREREIRILLSDVIVNRLVVLFAKTGTGKTSLINAGVRPRLEPDYETFYIRVEDDPIRAAREALRAADVLPRRQQDAPLHQQLSSATRRLGRPTVLFFDQFEEFFEHISAPAERQRFVQEIAEIYQDEETQACVVFSMREEYFHEMDDFREQVPSIFHKSSNLRLRLLDDEQARQAIAEPVKQFDVVIEDELVERLVADLHTDKGISPAHLQIVCDTLWRERAANATAITLQDYLALGGGEGSPGDRIYQRRVEEDLSHQLDDRQLEIFGRLMPTLRTEKQTKRPKELTELVEQLQVDAATLDQLVERLRGIGLIRVLHRYGTVHVEWTSDYLASRTDDLIEWTTRLSLLRLIMLRGQEQRRLEEHRRSIQGRHRVVEPWKPPMALRDLQALSKHAELVKGQLDPEQAEFVFTVSLFHGEQMGLWSRIATEVGADIWRLLEQRIADESTSLEEVGNSLRFLAASRDVRAQGLLGLALRQDSLSSQAVDVIADSGNDDTIGLLEAALEQPALAAQTVAALSQQSSVAAVDLLAMAVQQLGDVALDAASSLYRISTGRPSLATARAGQVFDGLLEDHAQSLFVQALSLGQDTEFWWQQVVERGVDVWPVLERSLQDPSVPLPRATNAVALLGAIAIGSADHSAVDRSLGLLERALTDDRLAEHAVAAVSRLRSTEAVQLLEQALRRDSTTLHAARSLYDIAEQRVGEASSDAGDVVEDVFRRRVGGLFVRALARGEALRFWFDRANDYGVDGWALVGERLQESDVAPDPAQHAVRLLGELAKEPATQRRALDLLLLAMRQGRLAAAAVSAVAAVGTAEAIELLQSVEDPQVAAIAQRALEDMSNDWSVSPELRQRVDAVLHRSPQPDRTREAAIGSAPPPARVPSSTLFGEHDWDFLVRAIDHGELTPIIGASVPPLPTLRQVAARLAEEFRYPRDDIWDLAAVAEYIGVTRRDPMYAKRQVARIYQAAVIDHVQSARDVHTMLASLPLPVYLTMAFDDLTASALEAVGRRPVRALSNWNVRVGRTQSPDLGVVDPTPERPLVLHLHGHADVPESIVLTDDDQLDLFNRMSDGLSDVVPVRAIDAMSFGALLLLWVGPWAPSGRTYRLLLRLLPPRASSRTSVSVQIPPHSGADPSDARRYIEDYLAQLNIRVHWGKAEAFCGELQRRWNAHGQ